MNSIPNICTSEMSIYDTAYKNLQIAVMSGDRKAIETCCNDCRKLGIPSFHEKANSEMERIYHSVGIRTIRKESSLDELPYHVLSVYALSCMNVLLYTKLEDIRYKFQYAFQILSRPVPFHSNDILYTQQNKQLTVGDFLKVIKYAISIAEIVNPDDEVYSRASTSILALQTIDNLLNNRSGAALTKHTLHVAADFIASNVKESLNDVSSKRNVAISALMVNLAIDFLIKE